MIHAKLESSRLFMFCENMCELMLNHLQMQNKYKSILLWQNKMINADFLNTVQAPLIWKVWLMAFESMQTTSNNVSQNHPIPLLQRPREHICQTLRLGGHHTQKQVLWHGVPVSSFRIILLSSDSYQSYDWNYDLINMMIAHNVISMSYKLSSMIHVINMTYDSFQKYF